MSVDSELLRKCMVRAKIEVVRTVLKVLIKDLHLEKPGELELRDTFQRIASELHSASAHMPLWPRETESSDG